MDELIPRATDVIAQHGMWAGPIIGLLAFGESLAIVGLFIPATALMIATGGLIGTGVLPPLPVLLCAMGGAILDINEPSKVLYRCENHLLTPEEPYETTGFVPNVVFPCATLQDGDTGRIAIYYGAADTNVGLAFTTVDEVVTYIKAHSKLQWGDDIAQDDF